MNFREVFNIRARGKLWSRSSEKFQMYFKYALIRLESIDNFFIPNQLIPPKTLEQRVYRLELGYFGIGMPSGIPSNLATRASSRLRSNECVNDHLIGATEIGKYIHQTFKEKDYDTNWMQLSSVGYCSINSIIFIALNFIQIKRL